MPWPVFEPMTASRKSDNLTTASLSHVKTTTPLYKVVMTHQRCTIRHEFDTEHNILNVRGWCVIARNYFFKYFIPHNYNFVVGSRYFWIWLHSLDTYYTSAMPRKTRLWNDQSCVNRILLFFPVHFMAVVYSSTSLAKKRAENIVMPGTSDIDSASRNAVSTDYKLQMKTKHCFVSARLRIDPPKYPDSVTLLLAAAQNCTMRRCGW